jgi:hypothetical protein
LLEDGDLAAETLKTQRYGKAAESSADDRDPHDDRLWRHTGSCLNAMFRIYYTSS